MWLRTPQVSEDSAELKVETRLSVSEKSLKDDVKLWVETEIFSPKGESCGKQREKVGKEKESDSPLESPERKTACQHLDFSPVRSESSLLTYRTPTQ